MTVLPGDAISSGAPVPDGATAIVANVTAVRPTTEGFVSRAFVEAARADGIA